jgi:hypothetical protein
VQEFEVEGHVENGGEEGDDYEVDEAD